MAIRAICVRCGKPKKSPFLACRACGFAPETEYQMGRALILSLAQDIGGVPIGRDAGTLRALSAQIQAGRFYEFDPSEEQRAVAAWHVLRESEKRRRARAGRALRVAVLAVLGLLIGAAWLYR